MSLVNQPNIFARLQATPLDQSFVVDTYSSLVNYVTGSGIAYAGQVIAVSATNTAYIVNNDLATATPIGNIPNTLNITGSASFGGNLSANGSAFFVNTTISNTINSPVYQGSKGTDAPDQGGGIGTGGNGGYFYINGGSGYSDSSQNQPGGPGGTINISGGSGSSDFYGAQGGSLIMVGGSTGVQLGCPSGNAGSINTSGGQGAAGGNIDTSNGGGNIVTNGTGCIGLGSSSANTQTLLCGTVSSGYNQILCLPDTHGVNGTIALRDSNPSIRANIFCGATGSAYNINSGGSGGCIALNGGNANSFFSGGNGGNIIMCGGVAATAGSINTSSAYCSQGGSINTCSGNYGVGGTIDTSSTGAPSLVYINAGGGSIITRAYGGCTNGGNINTLACGCCTCGGYINTSACGYCTYGGCINTSASGDYSCGGSIDTSNGGGSIVTNGSGRIGLGSAPSDTQTMLCGTATTNRAICFPDSSGTVFVNNDSITLSAANIQLTSATISTFTNPVTASGSFLVLNINGNNKAIQLWDYTS